MNDGSHAKTCEEAGKAVGSKLPDQSIETAACPAFQSLSHDVHTEEEQAQTAEKIEYIKNRHCENILSILVTNLL